MSDTPRPGDDTDHLDWTAFGFGSGTTAAFGLATELSAGEPFVGMVVALAAFLIGGQIQKYRRYTADA